MLMKSQIFVRNHVKSIRKTFFLRMLFSLLLIASLGFNVYFFTFKDELSSVAIANDFELEKEIIFREKRAGLQPVVLKSQPRDLRFKTNIHEEKQTPNFNLSNEVPSHSFKKILFDPSTQSNESDIQVLKLKVKNSLNYSVCQEAKLKGACGSLAAHIARLLAWFLDVNREMRNGDDLTIVYERLGSKDQFKILQLVYTSDYIKKKIEVNFFQAKGMKYGGYFNREGKEIAQRIVKEQSPIDEYMEITSLPGDFRKGNRGHSGTDFKAEVGTPIRSTFDGRVNRVNWNVRANGYCIEIDHPNQKIKTRYLHLDRVLVKKGQYLKQGEVIAKSGNTGRSFAPHLHYEVRSRDKRKNVYNPFDFKYHKTYHRKISHKEMDKFQKKISAYDALYEKNKIDWNIQNS